MRELWLMRHGQAVADARGGDSARDLTEEGEASVRAVAKALGAMGVRPTEIWHSPFLRAVRTAGFVAEGLRVERLVPVEELTPHGGARVAAEQMFRADAPCLFVVSHLPVLPEICGELLGTGVRLDVSTASVVSLALLGAERARGSAVLTGFYRGELLEALAD